MKFIIDHDLHIHTHLSLCSKDERQTPAAILDYAIRNNLNKVCVTDHYWDSAVTCNTAVNWWYEKQDFDHISSLLPLPCCDGVRFLFGCEADMDSDNRIGLPASRYNDFDFIIVSTTHFHHLSGDGWLDQSPKALCENWFRRMYTVLDSDLPFYKVGIAHPVCKLINKASREAYLETLKAMPDGRLNDLFSEASKAGVGIEINSGDFKFEDCERDIITRMFVIAKECGCKFYLGSDAHTNGALSDVIDKFSYPIDILELTEDDKFII